MDEKERGGENGNSEVFFILMTLVDVLAVIGNAIIIAVILKSVHALSRKPSNMFILFLCIINVTAALIVLPTSIYAYGHESWVTESVWCTSSGYLANFCIFATVCCLAVISTERFFKNIY